MIGGQVGLIGGGWVEVGGLEGRNGAEEGNG